MTDESEAALYRIDDVLREILREQKDFHHALLEAIKFQTKCLTGIDFNMAEAVKALDLIQTELSNLHSDSPDLDPWPP